MNHRFDPHGHYPLSPKPIVPILPPANDFGAWVDYVIPRVRSHRRDDIERQVAHLRRRLLRHPGFERRLAEEIHAIVQNPPADTSPAANEEWASWLVAESENSGSWEGMLDRLRSTGSSRISEREQTNRDIILTRATNIMQMRNLPFGIDLPMLGSLPESGYGTLSQQFQTRRMHRMEETLFDISLSPEMQHIFSHQDAMQDHLPPTIDVTVRRDDYGQLDEMLEAMIHEVTQMVARHFDFPDEVNTMRTRVRLYTDSNPTLGLAGGIAASTRMVRVEQLTSQLIMAALRPVMGSNPNVTADDFRYEFEFITADFLRGGASRELPRHLQGVNGLCYYASNDGHCAARALVLALASENQRRDYLKRTPPKRPITFRRRAIELGLPKHTKFADFGRLLEQEPKFTDYRIVILNELKTLITDGIFTGPLYVPPRDSFKDPKTIYLLYDLCTKHYTFIKSINEFTKLKHNDSRKWCHGCLVLKKSQSSVYHRCTLHKCYGCYHTFPTEQQLARHRERTDGQTYLCGKGVCNQTFPSLECRTLHHSICKGQVQQCDVCNHRISPDRPHFCDEKKCPSCHVYYRASEDHACFIAAPKADDDTKYADHYIFDFECMAVERILTIGKGKNARQHKVYDQKVNYAAVQKLGSPIVHRFKGPQALTDFGNFALRQSNSTFWAHNLRGYDGRLLYDHYTRVYSKEVKEIVWNGSKIMMMRFGTTKFLDSYCHIAKPLAAMPKVFGLDESVYDKGDFPHTFNTPENQDYYGPLPPLKYFQPDKKKPEARRRILEWHAQKTREGGMWNFQEELDKYCVQDVNILTACLDVYKQEGLLLNGGIDPLRSVTIASYALKSYRSHHMPEEHIAVLSEEEAAFARLALRGGRTDVRMLYKKYSDEDIENGIGARYVDVQSLYPFVQFHQPMPVGRPILLHFDDTHQPDPEDVRSFMGIIECDVTVHKRLFHPVLVNRENGKLLATLNDKVRQVFTSAELQVALKETDGAYRVGKVYRMLKFESSTELFKSYIRTHLKIKIECGGMPKHIKTEEDWEEFARYHEEVLGITLERDKMVANKGRKELAKLMLNSLWGKFAERNFGQETVTVKSGTDYALIAGDYMFRHSA